MFDDSFMMLTSVEDEDNSERPEQYLANQRVHSCLGCELQ